MEIRSKISKAVWKIKVKNSDLCDADIKFIENYNPAIFHNDLTGKLWAFDDKLPSGRWLENMEISNELDVVTALILQKKNL